MNKVISNHLILNFLKVILNVIFVFVCLGIILNLFEEIEFFKNLDVNITLPFFLTLMFIPNLIIKLLPFIIFVAAMWYFTSIKHNKDLLSLKVFGYSNLKIIFILSITAFLFGIFTIFAINPITSSMIKSYEKTKALYSKDIDHLVSINKNGVWIKETTQNNYTITSAKKVENNFLLDVTIYKLSSSNKIIERIDSEKVDVSNKFWSIYDAKIFNPNNENQYINKEIYNLKSNYDINKINSLYKNLDTISFLTLITEYQLLNEKGYSKDLLNEKLNIFFSLPIFLLLMVVLAAIFTIGSVAQKQNVYYIFISIITCVVVYYFKDLSIALGQTNRISLTLAVWMPIIAITLFCSIGVLQINEK